MDSKSKTEIAVLPPKENAIQVYTTEKGLDPYLAEVRKEIDGFVPDITTKKGRDAVASIAHKVARSKTALDNLGKELVSELKKKPALIDAERRRMRDLLDQWKEEVRQPLTEWEQAEKWSWQSSSLNVSCATKSETYLSTTKHSQPARHHGGRNER